MPGNELQTFLEVWDLEAKKTLVLLKALPPGQYDFRPDAGGRSLGDWPGTWPRPTPTSASASSRGRSRRA